MTERRGRPTLRCLTDDLDLDVPPLDVDLGDLEHPFLTELRRVTPHVGGRRAERRLAVCRTPS